MDINKDISDRVVLTPAFVWHWTEEAAPSIVGRLRREFGSIGSIGSIVSIGDEELRVDESGELFVHVLCCLPAGEVEIRYPVPRAEWAWVQ